MLTGTERETMKRQTRIKIRRIKYFLINSIKKVLYFPIALIKLILSPFYVLGAVFFPRGERRKHPRLDGDVYTHLKRIDRRLDWLDNKTSPTGILPTMISHELRLNERFKALEDSIKTINTRLKEAGILNDIELMVQPTDEELEAIEADARYSSDFEVVKVNRKEYDYKAEQRAMAKQIAKRAEEDAIDFWSKK